MFYLSMSKNTGFENPLKLNIGLQKIISMHTSYEIKNDMNIFAIPLNNISQPMYVFKYVVYGFFHTQI